MQIIRTTTGKGKKIAITLLIVLLLAGGGVALAAQQQVGPFAVKTTTEANDTNPEEEKSDDDQGIEDSAVEPADDKTTSPPTDDKTLLPSQSNPNSPTSSPEKPRITRAEQSGDNIRVSAILSGSSSGKCILRLERQGQRVQKEANIVVGPNYYACNGFLVPQAELSTGTWSVTVLHQLSGSSTASERRTLDVR